MLFFYNISELYHSMSKSIAIIKTNKFDKLNITKKNYYESVKSEIEQYVSIINVYDTQDMLVKMTETLLENKIEALTTERAYETENEIYEICHSLHWSNFDSINPESFDHTDEDKILEFPNNIANILTHNSLKAYGVAVLIKNTYDNNGVCSLSNITIDDIIKLIYKKTIFRGLKVNTNEEMYEFEYINNPIEYIPLQERPKYIGSTEVKVINRALIMYVDSLTEKELEYNKIASFLTGKTVYGDVFIALRQIPNALNYDDPEKPDYTDININTLINIVDIFKSPKSYKAFKNIDMDDEQEKHKPNITTFYSLINEYKEKSKEETQKRTLIKHPLSLNQEIKQYLSETLKKNK